MDKRHRVEVNVRILRSSGWEDLQLGERFVLITNDDRQLVIVLYELHQAVVELRRRYLRDPGKFGIVSTELSKEELAERV